MATITFTANNFRRPTGRIASWFSVALIACLSSCVALYLVSLIDPNLLVPVSVDNIIGAIPLAIFCYLIGIVLVSRRSRIPNRVFLFTVIFLLRIVTGFTLAFLFQYDDERAFHEAGTEQMYGLFSWAAGTGYYHLVNMMYAFFRPNLLLPKTLNALWGSLLPFFVYDLGKRFFGEDKAAWRAFLLAAFLPPLVLFSAVNLKEISTAFLLVLILWCLTVPRRSIWKIVSVMFTTGILYWLRGAPWAAVGLTGEFAYLFFGERWRLRSIMSVRWLFRILLVALLLLVVSRFFIKPIDDAVRSRSGEETYYSQQFADSSATIMQFVDVSNSLSPKNFVLLFLRGLYSPTPLRILYTPYHLDTVIEAFTMIVWYLVFPFAISGFLTGSDRGTVIACALTALAVLIMATTGVVLGSDPYRHRIALMGLVCTLAGRGCRKDSFRSFRWTFFVWWVGALLFTAAWIVFKV